MSLHARRFFIAQGPLRGARDCEIKRGFESEPDKRRQCMICRIIKAAAIERLASRSPS